MPSSSWSASTPWCARQPAITFGGLLIEIMVGVWAIANVMAPTMRDLRTSPHSGPVQGVARFVTSTPAPNPPIALDAGGGALSEPAVFATPMPTATPVGTIIPGAPGITGCPRDNAWLLVPGGSQLIFETTTFWGTANISDFAFYRFDLSPPSRAGIRAHRRLLGSGH